MVEFNEGYGPVPDAEGGRCPVPGGIVDEMVRFEIVVKNDKDGTEKAVGSVAIVEFNREYGPVPDAEDERYGVLEIVDEMVKLEMGVGVVKLAAGELLFVYEMPVTVPAVGLDGLYSVTEVLLKVEVQT